MVTGLRKGVTIMRPAKLKRMYDIAYATALSSEGTGPRNFARLGAVLFDKAGRVLTAKTNSMKTHPILARYTPYPNQHAETACLLGHGLDNCNGTHMMVVRVRMDNSPAMAKPCNVCQKMLRVAGVNRVYYTDIHGNINQMEM